MPNRSADAPPNVDKNPPQSDASESVPIPATTRGDRSIDRNLAELESRAGVHVGARLLEAIGVSGPTGPTGVSGPEAAPPAPAPKPEADEEEEEGGMGGMVKRMKDGIEKVHEWIQSIGAGTLEQLAGLLKMLGADQWADKIREYIAGADIAQLNHALDARRVNLLDPRASEKATPEAIHEFLTQRKSLFDSFNSVTGYTKKEYYTAVVNQWVDRHGGMEVTPTNLLLAANDIPRVNPLKQTPETYTPLATIPPNTNFLNGPVNLSEGGRNVSMGIDNQGMVTLTEGKTVKRYQMVPDTVSTGTTIPLTLTRALWTIEGLVMDYSVASADNTTAYTAQKLLLQDIRSFITTAPQQGAFIAESSGLRFEYQPQIAA